MRQIWDIIERNIIIIELRDYANVVWNSRIMLNAVLDSLVAKPQYLSSLDIEQSAYVIQF